MACREKPNMITADRELLERIRVEGSVAPRDLAESAQLERLRRSRLIKFDMSSYQIAYVTQNPLDYRYVLGARGCRALDLDVSDAVLVAAAGIGVQPENVLFWNGVILAHRRTGRHGCLYRWNGLRFQRLLASKRGDGRGNPLSKARRLPRGESGRFSRGPSPDGPTN